MDTPFSLLEEALQEITGKESYYFGLAPADSRKGEFFLLCGTTNGMLQEELPYVLANFYSKTPFPQEDFPSFLTLSGSAKSSGREDVLSHLNRWILEQVYRGESDQRPNPTTSYLHLWDGENKAVSSSRLDEDKHSPLPQFNVYSAPSQAFRDHIQKAEEEGLVAYSFVSLPVSYTLEPTLRSGFKLHHAQGNADYLKERTAEATRIMDIVEPYDERMKKFIGEVNKRKSLGGI